VRTRATVRAMTAPHDAPEFGHPSTWPAPTEPLATASRPGRGRLVAVAVAGAVAVALLAAGGTWLATRSDPEPAAATSSAAPAQVLLAVAGVVILGRGQFVWARSTNACQGQGAFGDIRDGTQVTVTDAAGKVLAVGALGPGVGQGSSTLGATAGAVAAACELRFAVPAVPAGVGPYGVQFAGGAVLRFNEQQMTSLRIGF
jgi:hypothetical protein